MKVSKSGGQKSAPTRARTGDEHDRLLAALEASGCGTWRWDIQKDRVEWDEALCRVYGVSPAEAPRTAAEFIAIIHPDDRAHAGEVIRRSVEEGLDAEYEFRAVMPKGTIWIYDRSKVVRDANGTPLYMLGACLDVTARRQAEEERSRIATWLRMAMDVAQIGTWEFDPRTRTLTASESMDAIFGLPRDGGARSIDHYLSLVHPEDAAQIQKAMRERVEAKEPISVEYRLAGTGGDWRWLASRGALVRGADGRERLVGALFDITDRKRIEQAREATLHQRELLLKELNHRVKNNLQIVSSLLNMQAARMTDRTAREEFRKAIDRIHTIGDIHVHLYQGEQLGRVEFDRYLVELCDRIRASMLEDRRVTLGVETEPIMLDMDRAIPLGLIVNELVTNAIRHAFPDNGGGTINVRLQSAPDGGVALTIGDTGRGLASAPAGEPKGIGMKLVEGLLQQVGGTLTARQQPGMEYVISLPADAPAERN